MTSEQLTAQKPSFYIIDGNSYIYRAFYAIKNLSTSYGLPTNAVFGFANMLLKVIKERSPDLLAIAFDPKGPTRRHLEFREYKAHRPPMPRDLVPQIPYIHRMVEAFRIPVFILEGQEADDVIATLARKAEAEHLDVTIVTGDKDILQLVGPNIRVYDTLKDKIYEPKDVEERFGVPPDRMIEIMGLMGDASDNIPGVDGIGEKTAQMLVRQYGTIENLLIHAHEITKPKLKQSLIESADRARLSRELAQLHADVPLTIDYEALKTKEPDNVALLNILRELEFTALLKYVAQEPGKAALYRTVLEESDFQGLIRLLSSIDAFCFDTETSSLDAMQAELVGISFSVQPYEAYYLPLGHVYPGAPKQINRERALAALKTIFENPSIKKIGQNIKYDLLVLGHYGIAVSGVSFDTMIASYLLNPGRASHSLDAIALEFLNYRTTTYKDVTGAGKNQIGFQEVDIEAATRYSGEDADIALRLERLLEPRLREQNLEKLFRELEMPLMEVLADIERTGVKIDAEFLRHMSRKLEKETARITETIYELAGTEFNINSPKQLADILFGKLGLTPVKKTKTGFSTNVDVLEELAHLHALPAEILRFRTLSKLKSTYIDALPAMINPRTARLHTSLNQTVTATGRLSSSEPNLQNIPIRTDVGREIRRAFIAERGASLLSADYSQIELRVLAHMSQDTALIKTFQEDQDIHTRTASEIFGLPPDEITPEMRRKAKAVNFGIIYGISAVGLAQDIGVSNTEAKRYIDSYFTRYPNVREFLDKTIQDAKANGYVTTLLGRRRFIPELSSSTASVRSFGERTAVNTPIQGTAADLIKLAMIHIHQRLKQEHLQSKMILQVHDELVFEVEDSEIEHMKKLVKEEMEGVLILSVPIKVDMGVGKNWDEAH
ncbi:MAG TPA: DNA polymerase I [Nitrospirota bacterium]|nr:DNA polymerase I [Nitrospirota bacterium]